MTEVASPSRRRTVASALYVTAWPALLLVMGGDPRWIEGWIFAIWLVGLYLIVTIWMHVKDPALLAERRRRPGADGALRADRALIFSVFVLFAVWLVLMPLDASRYHWTAGFPLTVKAAGGALLVLSGFFLFRAVHDNTFLSGVVRVQADRAHRVVSRGVYSVVRHPM